MVCRLAAAAAARRCARARCGRSHPGCGCRRRRCGRGRWRPIAAPAPASETSFGSSAWFAHAEAYARGAGPLGGPIRRARSRDRWPPPAVPAGRRRRARPSPARPRPWRRTRGSVARTSKSWLSRLRFRSAVPIPPEREPQGDERAAPSGGRGRRSRAGCSEGHADPDLARPLVHQVREHAVDADGGQEQGDQAEGQRGIARASGRCRRSAVSVRCASVSHVEERQLRVAATRMAGAQAAGHRLRRGRAS